MASAGIPAAAVALVGLLAAATLTATSIGSADRAIDRRTLLDAQGRMLLRVISQTNGRPLSASRCDALAGIHGVIAAGGTRTLATVRLGTGQLVNVEAATASYVTIVAGHGRPDAGTAAVVGADLARDLGLTSRGFVGIDGPLPPWLRSAVLAVTPLPATPRTSAVDDSLLLLRPPSGAIDECIVEPTAQSRAAVEQAAQSLARPDVPVVVLPFRDDIERDRTPEHDLAAVAADPLSWLAGAIVVVALAAWWYTRRQDWALYRTFGAHPSSVALIALWEWLLVGCVPFVAGTAWGTWATQSCHPAWEAISAGWTNAGVALMVSGLAVGLLRIGVQGSDHTTTFRGR